MEKEPIIVSPREKRDKESAHIYYLEELRSDLDVFSESIRPDVLKFINGERLNRNRMRELNWAVEKWWQDKYGFPFANKISREEVLIRKHNPDIAIEAHKLQAELLTAVQRGGNESKIKELKKQYQDTYPDQMEAIEVIFGIKDFLEKSKKVDDFKKRENGRTFGNNEYAYHIKELTEYQFLFTHFIIENNHDREFLSTFWSVAELIASKMGMLPELNILRRGQMSQVAIFRVLTELGDNPKLAHPKEDAFGAIDVWEDPKSAIQIVGWQEEVPAVFETDKVSFPAFQVNEGATSVLYNSVQNLKSKNSGFRAKLEAYGKRMGKNYRGYMLAVPYSKIDFINGEPAPELIEFFRTKLKS